MNHSKGKRLRKKNVLLLGLGFAGLLGAALLVYGFADPVHFVSSAPKVEIYGTFNAKDNIRSVFLGSADDVAIKGSVDTENPGDYTVTYTFRNKSYPLTVTVADYTPPVLGLRDMTADIDTELDAESFVVKCDDLSRVSLTIDNPNSLRTNTGSRKVTITAMDEFGNKTTKNTELTRIHDEEPPVVTESSNERTVLLGTWFEPRDLQYVDNTDTECDVEVDSQSVNTWMEGRYPVTYTITDAAGNRAIWRESLIVTSDPSLVDELPEPEQTMPEPDQQNSADDQKTEDLLHEQEAVTSHDLPQDGTGYIRRNGEGLK